ncbi:hypothetical protein MKW92_042099 [Papaver armeniacum]|nr:hypothetical protein MKW92_042099 [Papaver armeniacum]
MRAHATNEMDVIGASADEIWAVYSSKDLWKLMVKLQPDVFERVYLVAFDGGVGTIIHMVMTPGFKGLNLHDFDVELVRIDHGNKVLVVQQTRGGYLDLGYSFFQITFEILAKDDSSCVIRTTTSVETDEKFDSNASTVAVDEIYGMAKAIAKYVLDNKARKDCSLALGISTPVMKQGKDDKPMTVGVGILL